MLNITRLINVESFLINRILNLFKFKNAKMLPPTIVRGMKILDRETFKTYFEVPIIGVTEMNLSNVTAHLKKYYLKKENFKPIKSLVDFPPHSDSVSALSPSLKYVVLNPSLVNSWTDLNCSDREHLSQFDVTEKSFSYTKIMLNYDNWSVNEIFDSVLPPKNKLSSYSNIGHIVHVNLEDELLDYKYLIGQVLIDKVKTCKTVINKTNNIDNKFRNFSLEVLCGEEDFLVKVKENHRTFELDFSQVYWNPRLSTEHGRIVEKLKKDDVLFDVFAGIGPFSIPASKKMCIVYANDLNPESYKWLVHNAKLNKIKDEYFNAFNLDGHDFIVNVFAKYFVQHSKASVDSGNKRNIHIAMNLPGMAVDFLSSFRGALKNCLLKDEEFIKPIIHLYCFVASENCNDLAKRLVEEKLGYALNEDLIDVFHVRDVAPNKEMMRVTFYLSKSILFTDDSKYNENKRSRMNEDDETAQKQLKLSDD